MTTAESAMSTAPLVSAMLPGYRLMSKREAAEILGFTIRTLDRLIINRKIPHIRLPSIIRGRQGRVRFDSRDIDRWLQEHRRGEAEGDEKECRHDEGP